MPEYNHPKHDECTELIASIRTKPTRDMSSTSRSVIKSIEARRCVASAIFDASVVTFCSLDNQPLRASKVK